MCLLGAGHPQCSWSDSCGPFVQWGRGEVRRAVIDVPLFPSPLILLFLRSRPFGGFVYLSPISPFWLLDPFVNTRLPVRFHPCCVSAGVSPHSLCPFGGYHLLRPRGSVLRLLCSPSVCRPSLRAFARFYPSPSLCSYLLLFCFFSVLLSC